VGAAIAIGAVVGLAMGIVVSVPLAPEPLSEADQRDFGWLAGGYGRRP
jgi:hypothetical protein